MVEEELGDAAPAFEPDDAPTGPIDVHESFLHEKHPLHRPRHGRHVGAGAAAVVFLLVPALVFVLGVRPVAFENRALAPLPVLSDGWGFLGGMPQWASDRLPLRQQAVQAADGISEGVFDEPFPLGASPAAGGAVGPVAPAVPGQDAQAGTGTRPMDNPNIDRVVEAGFDPVIQGTDGWLYYGYDVFAACRPTNPLSDVQRRLQRLRSAVESSGRQLVVVVPPNKSSAVPEHLPAEYTGRSCYDSYQQTFWPAVVTAGALDLRPALAAAAGTDGPVWFQQDTHWTYAGGRVLARVLAEQVQPGVTSGWSDLGGDDVDGPADLAAFLGTPRTSRVPYVGLDLDGTGNTVRDPESSDSGITRTTAAAGPGRVTAPLVLLGDSFSSFAQPFVSAAFPSSTFVSSALLVRDPSAAVAAVASGDVVVFEIVQRDVADNIPGLLSDANLDRITAALAASPR